MRQYNINLDPKKIPDAWYNIGVDMPEPMAPVLHPGTRQPVGPDDLSAIFPMGLIMQEMSPDRYISIPGEVMDKYLLWRPTPLRRAYRMEEALDTPSARRAATRSTPPSRRSTTTRPKASANSARKRARGSGARPCP